MRRLCSMRCSRGIVSSKSGSGRICIGHSRVRGARGARRISLNICSIGNVASITSFLCIINANRSGIGSIMGIRASLII